MKKEMREGDEIKKEKKRSRRRDRHQEIKEGNDCDEGKTKKIKER